MSNPNFITKTELEGVLIIERPVLEDDRGFFRELFRKSDIEAVFGKPIDFVQASHPRSKKNTLRGIHIAPWHKLVTCTRGQAQQVVVDTRPDSPTFGKHVSIILGEDNFKSVFIPAGCGNSFLALTDVVDYTYMASEYWAPGKELNVAYNDPTLAIEWQTTTPELSEKDSNNPTLYEVFPEKQV